MIQPSLRDFPLITNSSPALDVLGYFRTVPDGTRQVILMQFPVLPQPLRPGPDTGRLFLGAYAKQIPYGNDRKKSKNKLGGSLG